MATTPPLLTKDDDLIQRLEVDLIAKVNAAFTSKAIDTNGNVHGVFSLDMLEELTLADLCKHIAVGIGYSGAQIHKGDVTARTGENPGSSNAARLLDFTFMAVLAVPTEAQCDERHDATKLLTIMRRAIMGTEVTGDVSSRKWMFEREGPNVGESDTQMLFYTQVWRIAIVNIGNSINP